MPEIPRYKRKEVDFGASGALLDPGKLSIAQRTIAQAGKDIAELGGQGTRVAGQLLEERRNLERSVVAARVENELRTEIDKAADSLLERQDYENFDSFVEESLRTIAPKYRGRAGGDRFLEAAIERALSDQERVFRARAGDRKTTVIKDRGQAEFSKLYEGLLERWAWADEKGKGLIEDEMELKLALMTQSGVFSLAEEGELLRQFPQRAQERYFRTLINTDPKRAVEELKEPANGAALGDKRPVIAKQAKEAARVQEVAEKGKKEAHVYDVLYSRFNGDADEMRKALMDPKTQKEFELESGSVSNIEALVTDFEKVNRARIGEREAEYLDLNEEGKLTIEGVLADLRAYEQDPKTGIDGRTAGFWIGQIRARQTRLLEEEERFYRKKVRGRAEAELEREERVEPIETNFTALYSKGLLREEDVLAKMARFEGDTERPLDAEEGVAWINLIRGQRSEQFVALHDRITRGDPTLSLSELTRAGGLTANERSTLVGKFKTEQSTLFNEAEGRAKEILTYYIYKHNVQGVPIPDPEAASKMMKAYQAIDHWEEQWRASGRAFDQDASEEFFRLVGELGEKYKVNLGEAVENMTKAMKTWDMGNLTGEGQRPRSIEEYERQQGAR